MSEEMGGRRRRPDDDFGRGASASFPQLRLTAREQRALAGAGRRDGRSNMPDAESLTPWPTPATLGILAQGEATRRLIRASCQKAMAEPRIRLAVATHKASQARKQVDDGEPRPDEAAHLLATAEASLAAAEIRLATIESIGRERLAAARAVTQERLAAYWAANLAAREPPTRLLLEQLRLPDVDGAPSGTGSPDDGG